MRYVIQLLAKDQHSQLLNQLRLDAAQIVGQNKALDYPLPHITILSNIQDQPNQTIDRHQLIQAFKTFQCLRIKPAIESQVALIDRTDTHLSLDVQPADQLHILMSQLRQHLQPVFKQAGNDVAIAVSQEHWFHVTLAQHIQPNQQQKARQHLRQAIAKLPQLTMFDRLALWSKDPAYNQPYQLRHTRLLTDIVPK